MATDVGTAANADQIAYWNSQVGETWVGQQDRLDRRVGDRGGRR